MKIIAISDTHMMHHKLKMPKGDVLVVAGDVLNHGTEREALMFNDWLGTLKYKHKIVVPSNHDIYAEIDPVGFKMALSNAKVLMHEGLIVEGVKIFGMPWTPTFGCWAFMYDRHSDFSKQLINKIPSDADILVSHGPAYGNGLGETIRGDDAGCQQLSDRMRDMKKLKAHICGHIHHGRGIVEMGSIKCYNATVVDEQYRVVYEPMVIKYGQKKA